MNKNHFINHIALNNFSISFMGHVILTSMTNQWNTAKTNMYKGSYNKSYLTRKHPNIGARLSVLQVYSAFVCFFNQRVSILRSPKGHNHLKVKVKLFWNVLELLSAHNILCLDMNKMLGDTKNMVTLWTYMYNTADDTRHSRYMYINN